MNFNRTYKVPFGWRIVFIAFALAVTASGSTAMQIDGGGWGTDQSTLCLNGACIVDHRLYGGATR